MYDNVGYGDGDTFQECMPTTMIKLPFWKFNNVKFANLEKATQKDRVDFGLPKTLVPYTWWCKKAWINYNEVKVVNEGKLRTWKEVLLHVNDVTFTSKVCS
jgi:hypothetical protein